MKDIESIVKTNLTKLIDIDVSRIDIDLNIFDDYSLTSLNLVIMITNICDETDIPVFKFTDTDIANLRTLRDVVTMFTTAASQDA
jgi:acyl carrier protein